MSVARRVQHLSPGGLDFETSCMPWQGDLLSWAERLCRDREAARDIVQDSLLRMWRRWSRFYVDEGKDASRAVRSYLMSIVTRQFLTECERRRSESTKRKRLGAQEVPQSVRTLGGTVDPRDNFATISDDVVTALGKLDARSREMIERCDLRGELYKDIAIAMNMPIGTVMSGLFRARKRLALELAAYARTEYRIERHEPENVGQVVVLQAVGS